LVLYLLLSVNYLIKVFVLTLGQTHWILP